MNNYTEWHDMYHHGTKGQRWGFRRAKWYPIAAFRKSMRNGKKSTTEPKSEKKKETPDELKARIRRTNDVSLAYKNRSLFTSQEINEIIARSETEKRLGDVAKHEKAEADVKKQAAADKRREAEEAKRQASLKHFGNLSDDQIRMKNDIIISGDVKRALKNKQLFTNEELSDVLVRAESEQKLNDFLKDSKNRKAQAFLKTTNVYTSEAATFIQNAEKIYKAGKTFSTAYKAYKKRVTNAK